MFPFASLLGSGNIGPVTFVTGGAGLSSDLDFDLDTTGLVAGDYLFFFSDSVSDGASAVIGGEGSGWTLDTVIQAGGQRNRCQHKRLVAADIGVTLTCKVSSAATTVRYVVYRGVSKATRLQSVASAAAASVLAFSAVSSSQVTSRIVASITQHDALAGTISAPANWTGRVTQFGASGNKLIADLNTLLYAPGTPSFNVSETSADGQTGFLYDLLGFG